MPRFRELAPAAPVACGLFGSAAAQAQEDVASRFVEVHAGFLAETPGGYDGDGLPYAAAVTRDLDGVWLHMSILLGDSPLAMGPDPDEDDVVATLDRFCDREMAQISIGADGDYQFHVIASGRRTTYRAISSSYFSISYDIPELLENLGLNNDDIENADRMRHSTLLTLPRDAIVTRPHPDILTIRTLGQAPTMYARCPSA